MLIMTGLRKFLASMERLFMSGKSYTLRLLTSNTSTSKTFIWYWLFMLYKVAIICKFMFMDETSQSNDSNESCQLVLSCSPVILLYKVVIVFESVDETSQCDNSNESYQVVLCYGTVLSIMLYKPVLTFESVKQNLFSSTFKWCYFFFQYFSRDLFFPFITTLDT